MSIQRFAVAWILASALVPALQAGENWPGWRGPTGMGQSDEKDLPLSWEGKTKKNLRWKTALFPSDTVRPDQNQSSPIVWGDSVFVTVSYWRATAGEGEYPEHRVMCFASDDGTKQWDVKIAPGPWKLTDLRGGYTAPTPACDGQRVYVVFGSAVIAAVNLRGKLVWRKEITPHAFDVAIGASPVLFKDTVLFDSAMSRGSNLRAYDAATGALKWQKERPKDDWAHSTPALATIAGKTQLLVAASGGPQGVDPATGEPIWWYRTGDRLGDTVTPVLAAGLVYVDSGRGSPGIAIDPSGAGDVTKSQVKWSVKNVPDGFSSPVVVGDYLYRLHAPGVISCWKAATGEQVYKERLEGVDPAVSPIATADGRIYCASAGRSYVLKAGPTFEVLGRGELNDASRASPAVAAGCVYLKGSRYLYCVGVPN